MHVSVVVPQSVVVTLALDGNAILRAGKFILKTQEILVRLQLRIVLDHQQQPAQRPVELPVGRDFLLRRTRGKQGRARLRDISPR